MYHHETASKLWAAEGRGLVNRENLAAAKMHMLVIISTENDVQMGTIY